MFPFLFVILISGPRTANCIVVPLVFLGVVCFVIFLDCSYSCSYLSLGVLLFLFISPPMLLLCFCSASPVCLLSLYCFSSVSPLLLLCCSCVSSAYHLLLLRYSCVSSDSPWFLCVYYELPLLIVLFLLSFLRLLCFLCLSCFSSASPVVILCFSCASLARQTNICLSLVYCCVFSLGVVCVSHVFVLMLFNSVVLYVLGVFFLSSAPGPHFLSFHMVSSELSVFHSPVSFVFIGCVFFQLLLHICSSSFRLPYFSSASPVFFLCLHSCPMFLSASPLLLLCFSCLSPASPRLLLCFSCVSSASPLLLLWFLVSAASPQLLLCIACFSSAYLVLFRLSFMLLLSLSRVCPAVFVLCLFCVSSTYPFAEETQEKRSGSRRDTITTQEKQKRRTRRDTGEA